MRDLIEAQVKAGHQVGIICDASTGGRFEEALLADLRGKLALGLERIAMQRQIGPGDAMAALRTYKIIKKLRPDILHGHGAKGGIYARLFGSLLRVFGSRVARFYSPHGGSLHFDPAKLQGRIIFRVERTDGADDRPDHFRFCIRTRHIRRGRWASPAVRSALIYNGLADGEFEPVARGCRRRRLPVHRRNACAQGTGYLHQCAAQGERDEPGASSTGVMVGDGKDRARLIEQSANAGHIRNIRFLMPMKARQAFRLAKVVVIPSRAEALPYIVLEALAAGRPVIASRVGGIPEILGDASPALVEPEAGDLAARMATAINDVAAYKQTLPGMEELKQKFSIETMATRLESEYFAALGSCIRFSLSLF